eukprot:3477119-Amphidinium_carterae.1
MSSGLLIVKGLFSTTRGVDLCSFGRVSSQKHRREGTLVPRAEEECGWYMGSSTSCDYAYDLAQD